MIQLNLPEKVETERLLLQRLKYEDAEEIFYSYASKPEVTHFLSWKTHGSVEDTQSFLKYAIMNWNIGVDYSYTIRMKGSNKLVGGFGFINEDGKVQFGYAISPVHWGNGFATEACKSMMELIRQCSDVYRVATFVDSENIASMKVLEKSGLVKEAILKKWFRFVNQNNQPKDCTLYALNL
jgi:ribosomal-protein-alanine N-acetyltransferase